MKKNDDRQFTLDNSRIKTQRFWEKEMCTLRVNTIKDFPECRTGLGCVRDLIKRSTFETLVQLGWGNKSWALLFTWPQSLTFECPHGCVWRFILHKFLIVIICVFMEIIGAFPYSWAICQADIRHKSCPTICRPFFLFSFVSLQSSIDFFFFLSLFLFFFLFFFSFFFNAHL